MQEFILWAVFLSLNTGKVTNEVQASMPIGLKTCMFEAVDSGRYQIDGKTVMYFECRAANDKRSRVAHENPKSYFTVR